MQSFHLQQFKWPLQDHPFLIDCFLNKRCAFGISQQGQGFLDGNVVAIGRIYIGDSRIGIRVWKRTYGWIRQQKKGCKVFEFGEMGIGMQNKQRSQRVYGI
jgi:hypothetical protein